eukprot:7373871-Alexandrium_andersonii.AAC.1
MRRLTCGPLVHVRNQDLLYRSTCKTTLTPVWNDFGACPAHPQKTSPAHTGTVFCSRGVSGGRELLRGAQET